MPIYEPKKYDDEGHINVSFIIAATVVVFSIVWIASGMVGKKNRITSYNVCYTKLLRREKMFNTDYCQEYPKRPPKKAPVFCYRTLADVSCYSEPSTNPNDVLVSSTQYKS